MMKKHKIKKYKIQYGSLSPYDTIEIDGDGYYVDGDGCLYIVLNDEDITTFSSSIWLFIKEMAKAKS